MKNLIIRYAILVLCGAFIFGHNVFAGSSLTLESQPAYPMDIITIPVILESDEQVSALSADILYNPGKLEFLYAEAGPASRSKSLVSNKIKNGMVRLGFISFDQLILDSGVVAYLVFSLKPDVVAQKVKISLKANASNREGQPINITNQHGLVVVQ